MSARYILLDSRFYAHSVGERMGGAAGRRLLTTLGMARDWMVRRLLRDIARPPASKGVWVLATVLGVLCAAQTAVADESGRFNVVGSYVRDYNTIDYAGGTVTGGALRGSTIILESSGGPFVEGGHGLAKCVVYAKSSSVGLEVEAPCTTIHASGDRSYLLAKRMKGNIKAGGGGEGRLELVGGTGEYAGVMGSCTYEVYYLTDERVLTKAHCEWHSS